MPDEPPVILAVKPTTTTSVLVQWKVLSIIRPLTHFRHIQYIHKKNIQSKSTYLENKTPADFLCVYVCTVCRCNYHYLLNQEKSEGSADRLEECTDRRRDRQSWEGERNVQTLNEDIPAGEMSEGERGKHHQRPTTEEKRERELWKIRGDM